MAPSPRSDELFEQIKNASVQEINHAVKAEAWYFKVYTKYDGEKLVNVLQSTLNHGYMTGDWPWNMR